MELCLASSQFIEIVYPDSKRTVNRNKFTAHIFRWARLLHCIFGLSYQGRREEGQKGQFAGPKGPRGLRIEDF